MKAAGIIFSETHDNGLAALTANRTIASLPFGSRYRLVDFVLSNMVNSGINNIGVLTKTNYQSLIEHLGSCQAWDLNRKNGGLILIPPFATGNSGGYRGKLDELATALRFIEETCTEDYLVLADCATVSKLNYNEIIEHHIKSGKDMTIVAAKSPTGEKKTAETVLSLKDNGEVSDIYINYIAHPGQYLSLGTYVVGRKYLENMIVSLSAKGYHSLTKDFIQQNFNKGDLSVSVFEHCGKILRTYDVADYYNNNLALINNDMQDYFFRNISAVYTTVHDEVPTFYGNSCSVKKSLLADGCEINGHIENSVIFRGVTVEPGATIKNSIIMDASVISEYAYVENAIIDKNVTIGKDVHISGSPLNPIIISKGETI